MMMNKRSTKPYIFNRSPDLSVSDVFLADPVPVAIAGGSTYRVPICVRTPDGPKPLLFLIDDVYSYGVSRKTPFGKPEGIAYYDLPLVLQDRDGGTADQRDTVDLLDALVKQVKEQIIEKKKQLKRGTLVLSDLRDVSPIWRKKDEDGNIMTNRSPMIYPHLRATKMVGKGQEPMTDDHWKITTTFRDAYRNILDPVADLLGKKMTSRVLIHFESIFVGSRISFQVKVQEVMNIMVEDANESILDAFDAIDSSPVMNKQQSPPKKDDSDDDDEEEEDEDKDTTEEEVETTATTTTATTTPRRRRLPTKA